MGILLPSTTIKVLRSTVQDDDELHTAYSGDENSNSQTVAAGIPAHIGSPGGAETIAAGGQQTNMTFRFNCDPCDIQHTDIIEDEKTGKKYQVQWIEHRVGLGMDLMVGALRHDEGSEYING